MTEPTETPDESAGDAPRTKGFRSRKREDHALVLIRDLLGCLDDMPRVRELMRELSRYYDPVLGGAILLLGCALFLRALLRWEATHFGVLSYAGRRRVLVRQGSGPDPAALRTLRPGPGTPGARGGGVTRRV